jgi:hypothetical protein
MRRFLAFVVVVMTLAFVSWNYIYIVRNSLSNFKDGNIRYVSKVDNKNFYVYNLGKWDKEFIKGVNIGAGKPANFPG